MSIKNLINFQISSFELPVLHIVNTSPQNIQKIILKKFQQTHKILKYTPIIINVSNITYKSNWKKLYQSILDMKLYVIGVCSCNDQELKEIILKSGVPILTENKLKKCQHDNTTYQEKKKIKIEKKSRTKLINTPIRSGQKIYARDSDLIIINNVSPGAEVIADGNIHIYGIMKGRILAGASGNNDSQIFCTQFFPELVSINGHYLIGDHIPKKFVGKSVRLNLHDKTLIIHSL